MLGFVGFGYSQSHQTNAQTLSFFSKPGELESTRPIALTVLGSDQAFDLQTAIRIDDQWSMLLTGTVSLETESPQQMAELGLAWHQQIDRFDVLFFSLSTGIGHAFRQQNSTEAVDFHGKPANFNRFYFQPALHVFRKRMAFNFGGRVIAWKDQATTNAELSPKWHVGYEPGVELSYQLAKSGALEFSRLILQGGLSMTEKEGTLPMARFRLGFQWRPRQKKLDAIAINIDDWY